MSALGLIDPPKLLTTAHAILGEVWTQRLRGYANLELQHSPLRVVAWRCQGDVYHWVTEGVVEHPEHDGQQIVAFDVAIQRALASIPLMTVADALIAGESRRSPR